MSMFTMRHVLLLAAAALTTTACSSDRTHFYTLLKPDTAAPAIAGGVAFAINVQSLRVPAQVDQPELIVRQGEGELVLVETRQWIAPLKDEMRSEEHTSELQSLMRISYAVFCLKKNN